MLIFLLKYRFFLRIYCSVLSDDLIQNFAKCISKHLWTIRQLSAGEWR